MKFYQIVSFCFVVMWCRWCWSQNCHTVLGTSSAAPQRRYLRRHRPNEESVSRRAQLDAHARVHKPSRLTFITNNHSAATHYTSDQRKKDCHLARYLLFRFEQPLDISRIVSKPTPGSTAARRSRIKLCQISPSASKDLQRSRSAALAKPVSPSSIALCTSPRTTTRSKYGNKHPPHQHLKSNADPADPIQHQRRNISNSETSSCERDLGYPRGGGGVIG